MRCPACHLAWVARPDLPGACRRCGAPGAPLLGSLPRALVLVSVRREDPTAAGRVLDAMHRERFQDATRLAGEWAVAGYAVRRTERDLALSIGAIRAVQGVARLESYPCEST